MDPRLLQAYNEELAYLREAAVEFGKEHDDAGHLGLNAPKNADPYVERLLEGVAFLAARVNLKQRDQFPEFTQHLLQAIQPHYLAPTPSMCVVGFEPEEGDAGLVEGVVVPRRTELTAIAKAHGNAQVTFRTGHAVTLYPIRLAEVEYLNSPAAVAPFAEAAGLGDAAGTRPESGLRLRFAATAGATLSTIAPSSLPLYLAGKENVPGELYRQLIGQCVAVIARAPDSAGGAESWTRLPLPRQTGFAEDEALLPEELRSLRGYRYLSEYFACPERFLFVDLPDLARAFERCAQTCDVVLLFNRATDVLDGALTTDDFRLFATPAINLFERQIGRIEVDKFRHEHHVVPDRTFPLGFEVYRLLDVKAHSRDWPEPRRVASLYDYSSQLFEGRDAIYYTNTLRPRRLSTREQQLRGRTDYVGTESWISLTAGARASPGDDADSDREVLDSIQQLSVRALLTNRELPEVVVFNKDTQFAVAGVAVRSVEVLRAPTRPRPPLGLGDAAWRVIGHLTPNYATLTPQHGDDPAPLRDLIALYGHQDERQTRQQVSGIRAVHSQPITRRVPELGRGAIARGQCITIQLDDASYGASRIFLFSAVLERFLAEAATVNSFTECHFHTRLEGSLVKWPPRIGRRHSI